MACRKMAEKATEFVRLCPRLFHLCQVVKVYPNGHGFRDGAAAWKPVRLLVEINGPIMPVSHFRSLKELITMSPYKNEVAKPSKGPAVSVT